jgi:hypothetical protein
MRFSGLLKIPVEELMIALRGDADLLADPDALLALLSERSVNAASLDFFDVREPRRLYTSKDSAPIGWSR